MLRLPGQPLASVLLAVLATAPLPTGAAAPDSADGPERVERREHAVRGRTSPAVPATQLPEVVVSGSCTERSIDEVPATVTIRDASELERQQARDIRDLERYEPNVTVPRSPTRFTAAGASVGRAGNEGFTIRGLGGNRALIQIDGVRVPSAFAFGANAFGRGDWLDLATMRRVEILRGPASTLYGSDGLAGVVSFLTFDPADLLAIRGGDTYLTAGLAWAQEDSSFAKLLGGAVRSGRFEAMALYTRRDGHELRNQGTNDAPNATRTAPNPQRTGSDALLAKLVWRAGADNVVRLTVDALKRDTSTTAWSGVSTPPLTAASVIGLTGDDRLRRTRIVLDQRLDRLGWALADSLRWHVYTQSAAARQIAKEDRNAAADRVRDTRYDERWAGAGAVLERTLRTGSVLHRVLWGGDIARARYEALRDGTVPPAGETFPARPFPDTAYTLAGAFVQDEMLFADSGVALVPALRFDAFHYAPRAGALYHGDPVASARDSQLSPRLGIIWHAAAPYSVFANLSTGFRAPTADQINNGFANPVANYRSVANPDLRPETSRSAEVGLRRAGNDSAWTVSAFAGRYRDFIDQRQVGGSFTVADPAIFQYVNVGRVRLSGIEGSGFVRLDRRWRAAGGFGAVRGTNESTGQPLNTVDPWRVFAGLDFAPGAGRIVSLRLTHAGAKSAGRIDSAALVTPPATQYAPSAFTTIDLFGSWQVTRALRLSAGVFNLTDRKYWRWSDVRGLSSSSPVIDAYTQPGRSLAVNGRIEL